MTNYVLALRDNRAIHVGEEQDFIQHVGVGSSGGSFDPDLLVAFGQSFELYDDQGRQLAVMVDSGAVDLVPLDPEVRVEGPVLVARINLALAQAQVALDDAREAALEKVLVAVGATTTAKERLDDEGTAEAEVAFATALKELSDSSEEARGLSAVGRFPSLQGDLRVVLAALNEDFGSASHTPAPSQQGGRHDELHRQGQSHD